MGYKLFYNKERKAVEIFNDQLERHLFSVTGVRNTLIIYPAYPRGYSYKDIATMTSIMDEVSSNTTVQKLLLG